MIISRTIYEICCDDCRQFLCRNDGSPAIYHLNVSAITAARQAGWDIHSERDGKTYREIVLCPKCKINT